jgi:hypothetical protein
MRRFFRRLDRLMARFNKWLTPAALASGTLQDGRPQQADARHVTAILGEIERASADEAERREA